MIPKAREVRLKPKERRVLEALCRAPSTAQRDVRRARIVLLAAALCRAGPWRSEGASAGRQEADLRQGDEQAHSGTSGSAATAGVCPVDGAAAGRGVGRR